MYTVTTVTADNGVLSSTFFRPFDYKELHAHMVERARYAKINIFVVTTCAETMFYAPANGKNNQFDRKDTIVHL